MSSIGLDDPVKDFWDFVGQTSLTLNKCLLGRMPKVTGGRRPHLALHALTLDDLPIFTVGALLDTTEPFLCLETLVITSSSWLASQNASDHSGTCTVHPHPRMIILPALTRFTVGRDPDILANLTLPNLQTLILDKQLHNDKKVVKLLSDLFERGTNLRSLTLSFIALSPREFRQLFQHLPDLVVLELRNCSVELPPLTTANPWCPHLQTLLFDSSKLVDGRSLLDFVTTRKQSGQCRNITTLRISQCRSIGERDIAKIQTSGGRALRIEHSKYVEPE
ncbi:hypothetical protein B0H11DRAFT_177360 [Mycena galericulata]|nr:hypothetical protein B0H11DRAFT_177360 [Mycena galericulata]